MRLLLTALISLALAGQGQLTPSAKVAAEAIGEMSGIVKSRKFTDTYWVHNDSGDSPRFFAIREDGTAITPKGITVKGAKNSDWEDITFWGKDLVLCDLGNNGNRRRDLTLYVVGEPDPAKTSEVALKHSLHVVYPDQTEFPPAGPMKFDCEAVFELRGKLYIVTKHRANSAGFPDISGNLYRLDTKFTNKPNVLTKLDSKADFGGWVTAADVSPDGKTLAVLVQAPAQAVWLFSTKAPGDKLFTQGGKKVAISNVEQAEAIGFKTNKELIITNEQRSIFHLKIE